MTTVNNIELRWYDHIRRSTGLAKPSFMELWKSNEVEEDNDINGGQHRGMARETFLRGPNIGQRP